jgi:hypothetical protein
MMRPDDESAEESFIAIASCVPPICLLLSREEATGTVLESNMYDGETFFPATQEKRQAHIVFLVSFVKHFWLSAEAGIILKTNTSIDCSRISTLYSSRTGR